jgi:adenylate cyclase
MRSSTVSDEAAIRQFKWLRRALAGREPVAPTVADHAAGHLAAAAVAGDGEEELFAFELQQSGRLGRPHGALAVNYLITSFERQRVHDTFARFVPEAVVADVLGRVDEEDLRFGGVRRECTVLFSDLRGFTSFAEELEPERVIEVLNHYLGAMSDAIMDQGGTLVAYMGDGIMAVFGAPIEQPDHADRALAAAREMLRVRLPRFNEWLSSEGLGDGFAMGIGINSGTVMSGQVGSERRIEYTAIGDTTNTAARLEGMTKGSGHQVFVADSTKVAMRGTEVELQIVGEQEVRGRTQAITVWTLA